MAKDYLEGLNDAQRDAVLHTDGPLLVLAGAGSGKTRVITHRIVHLVHQGVAPHNILAVTFTNKAAKEMRERASTLLRTFPPSDRAVFDSYPTVTTFHSLGVRLLREFHATLNLPRHFVIYDRSDSVKAVKTALERAGYNPKQFEPRKMLSIISRAKGDAISQSDFSADARSYPEQVAAAVWTHYTEILRTDKALDFDDLLVKTLHLLREHPPVRDAIRNRYPYLHIDEYQDTNKVQFAIAREIAGEQKNICVVGDIDQCLIGETLITMANGSARPIKKIAVGDRVLSNYGSGDYRAASVTHVHKQKSTHKLTTITTKSGRKLTSTPNHLHFAGFRLGLSPQTYYVYLMRKDGVGYRLGTSCVYTKGQKKPMLGYVQRLNQEHGDALWVVDTFPTEKAAREAEYKLSLHYQLPTIPFAARNAKSTNGYVNDQTALDRIYANFDTHTAAEKLLSDYHLTVSHPHHRPQVSKSGRQNIIVSLCGDQRGNTPMHRISLAGSDTKTKKILLNAGYSIRTARANCPTSWRYETCYSSFTRVREQILALKKILPNAIVIELGRLGTQTNVRDKNSLPVISAASVRPGMLMFAADGSYDIVVAVAHDIPPRTVYDLTVEPSHNFVANNIVTHNSIYSWRGADIANVLQFERHFPGARTILLEENYRSTQTIIAASNQIIARNKNRVEKNVFTNNAEGEKITLYAAQQGIDEAEYIALQCKQLMSEGARASDIAILFRTNFQSRVLEEAFLNFNVPYQVLGTKFFERKEVKDVLSFLRLALNPETTADLARIVNVPPRGIGKVTALKLIEGRRAELTGATAEKVARFDQLMQDIADHAKTEPISSTLRFIISRSGLETHFKKSGTEDDLERLENLRELVSLAVRFDELDPEDGVEALLENAALQSDQDELGADGGDAVRLMTVHAAKGLEFPYVFITGLEEGLFPHERLDDRGVDHEEERRLFYVALTRAEKKVWLTYAHLRTIFGSQRVNVPSSFLNDIDTAHVETEGGRSGGLLSGYETTIYLD
jgi:DNA helicase-2/ATP-dependent DNA helicase PcrA